MTLLCFCQYGLGHLRCTCVYVHTVYFLGLWSSFVTNFQFESAFRQRHSSHLYFYLVQGSHNIAVTILKVKARYGWCALFCFYPLNVRMFIYTSFLKICVLYLGKWYWNLSIRIAEILIYFSLSYLCIYRE